MKEKELDKVKISVDILSPLEQVTSEKELNPKRFGILVVGNKSKRRGLLLPNIEGIKTLEQQLSIAIDKAVRQAKKEIIEIPLTESKTIPHEVEAKYGAAKVFLKPAKEGRGIIAGGAVRIICILGGIENITAKILGRTNNKLNNARAAIEALKKLKSK